jgi:hypothetical protein
MTFFDYLTQECGYFLPRDLGDDRWAALAPFGFTTALLVGRQGDLSGYEDRWCYHTFAQALAALLEWDGTGEPPGWHRHPGSGRRISESPDDYDENGNRVGAIGVEYVRF